MPHNSKISMHESTPWEALDLEVSMVELRKCKSLWRRSNRRLRLATLRAGTPAVEQVAKGGQAAVARACQRQGLRCRGSRGNPAIYHQWVRPASTVVRKKRQRHTPTRKAAWRPCPSSRSSSLRILVQASRTSSLVGREGTLEPARHIS